MNRQVSAEVLTPTKLVAPLPSKSASVPKPSATTPFAQSSAPAVKTASMSMTNLNPFYVDSPLFIGPPSSASMSAQAYGNIFDPLAPVTSMPPKQAEPYEWPDMFAKPFPELKTQNHPNATAAAKAGKDLLGFDPFA
jgi:hypothetical protein